jgi:hypothetical protein
MNNRPSPFPPKTKRSQTGRYGYLVWLGVDPSVQRFGVGKRLFTAFKELMEEDGCRIIMIDTQESNVPARRFFERAGFGSLESHVYFSKALCSDDAIASEERVLRQSSSSLPSESPLRPGATATSTTSTATTAKSKKAGGVKVSRLFRFKRAHSLLDGTRGAAAAATAAATAAAVGAMATEATEASSESGVDSEADKPPKTTGKGGSGKAGRKGQAATAAASAKRPRRVAAGGKKKKK